MAKRKKKVLTPEQQIFKTEFAKLTKSEQEVWKANPEKILRKIRKFGKP